MTWKDIILIRKGLCLGSSTAMRRKPAAAAILRGRWFSPISLMRIWDGIGATTKSHSLYCLVLNIVHYYQNLSYQASQIINKILWKEVFLDVHPNWLAGHKFWVAKPWPSNSLSFRRFNPVTPKITGMQLQAIPKFGKHRYYFNNGMGWNRFLDIVIVKTWTMHQASQREFMLSVPSFCHFLLSSKCQRKVWQLMWMWNQHQLRLEYGHGKQVGMRASSHRSSHYQTVMKQTRNTSSLIC